MFVKIARFAAMVTIVCLALAKMASAHEISPAISDLYLENGQFRLEIRLNLEAIIAEIGSEAENTTESPNADQYDTLRALPPAALDASFDRSVFAGNIKVLLDGEPAQSTVISVEIPEIGDLALRRDSTVIVTGDIGNARELRLGWDAAYGKIIIRLMGDGNDFNDYLGAGEVTDPILTTDATVISFWSNLVNYTIRGFYHIIPLGLDHILFITGLFLLSTRLKPLMWQITTFTLAHSVTLALGVLGIIVIPASIVEPLIAASIVYVCIENIFMSHLSRWRPILIFVFGLLHGQGFATILREDLLDVANVSQQTLLSALVGFNIGVEIGQISVILVCFLAVGFWFARRPWYRQFVTIPASVVIALIGAYWMVERIFFA